ncbi:MAG: type II toxin-antitoxin system death-on-curing family toxin [Planctomycetota bacterium]|jgi:death-on-curing protein|nr:type II toxin-antitoxin system death-on-curing family toxin [Planctomycetota bacterium]
MSGPLFLAAAEVMSLHADQASRFGGESGVREPALLESALAAPASGLAGEYFHSNPFAMAAAYLFHLAKNHPFVDGNKRTGLAAALAFLELNGWRLDCDPDELADLVVAIAGGDGDKAGAEDFFRRHAKEL